MGGAKGNRAREMEQWIDRFPPPDDMQTEERDDQRNARRRKQLLDMMPQAVLDLHGLTSAEAIGEINRFLEQSYKTGLQKVLIIHGKGNHSENGGVLAKIAADCISKHPLAGENALSAGRDGGRGSRWVVLRQRSR